MGKPDNDKDDAYEADLARLQLALVRYQQAAMKSIPRKVIEGAPEYANAHFLLGMSCVNLNKISDMKKHLEEYIRLDPKGKEVATAKEMLEAFK